MGHFVAEQTVKQLIQSGSQVKDAEVIVLGLTFKENCPDLRNSKVIDVIRELESYGATVHVHDPVAASAEAEHEYGVKLVPWEHLPKANAIVAAVSHKEFAEHSIDQMLGKLANGGVYVDVKCTADVHALRAKGVNVWRL
jgi:UDP-N-acetyl-D-galactosamine dehydrogenase